MTRCRMPPDSSCGWLPSRSPLIPTISSSSTALSCRARADMSGTCAASASVSWARIVITGLSAFIALCSTSDTCDQRSTRSVP